MGPCVISHCSFDGIIDLNVHVSWLVSRLLIRVPISRGLLGPTCPLAWLVCPALLQVLYVFMLAILEQETERDLWLTNRGCWVPLEAQALQVTCLDLSCALSGMQALLPRSLQPWCEGLEHGDDLELCADTSSAHAGSLAAWHADM